MLARSTNTQSNPLYCIEQIRQVEQLAQENLPVGTLMRLASEAACNFAVSLLNKNGEEKRVLVLAGTGDNGGDALGTAVNLSKQGFDISVLCFGKIDQYSVAAKTNFVSAQSCQIKWLPTDSVQNIQIQQWDLIIDGLFGIGLNRAIEGDIAKLITSINQQRQHHAVPLLALDVPSGLNADTGQIVGEMGVALYASHTITFIGDKPGLHTAKGKDIAGDVHLDSFNIASDFFPIPSAYLLAQENLIGILAPRQHDTNKGSFGAVMIIGGADGMVGAPLLAGRSALLCGAGRVYIHFLDQQHGFDHDHPELMYHQVQDGDLQKWFVVIGPGLGVSTIAKTLLRSALVDSRKLVIDADALNLIAKHKDLQELLTDRHRKHFETILTPHPLEASRLLNLPIEEIQANRCHAAQQLATQFQAVVILKGAGSVVADPDTTLFINSSGNPGLATAGTGDVLAGVCGALLAQNLSAIHAACLATYAHGKAADLCVEQGIGPIGLSASEIIPTIRSILNTLSNT